jgi:3-phenylpropionate/cinnamic acid dioxygenase small subunit
LVVEQLISLHGHVTDDGELDRYPEIFTDDVVYDLTDFGLGTLHGVNDVREAGLALGDANPVGHHVTNIVITENGLGSVTARSKGLGVMADGTTGSLTYDDTIDRQVDGTWRISRRKVVRRRRPLGAP